jgi:GR25 family glycosyltransferase involved in LPS biosynthesis
MASTIRSFVITLQDHDYSQRKADRCIQSALDVGKINVEKFYGVDKAISRSVMKNVDLEWTWANNNKNPSVCPITGLKQLPYYGANLDAKIGCSMSHYLLWKRCVSINEPILILEHDAVFIREFPEFDFEGICQINDPKGGGKNGRRLSEKMIKQNREGVHPKTPNTNDPLVPDGLAGNSAYVIKPFAAQELVDKFHELGVWPNDATMCIQLFPYLEEYYPFITKVEQDISTSSI